MCQKVQLPARATKEEELHVVGRLVVEARGLDERGRLLALAALDQDLGECAGVPLEGSRGRRRASAELKSLAKIGFGVEQATESKPDVGQETEQVRQRERISPQPGSAYGLLVGGAGLLGLSRSAATRSVCTTSSSPAGATWRR